MTKAPEVRLLDQEVETLPGRVIDVVVWGASRPHLFAQTIGAFKQHAKFSGQLRFFLEDGQFDPERAEQSVQIARTFGFDGIHVEKVGSYGWAMTNAMNRWVRAPLMFSLEDDWLCLRDIDLDLCFDCFEQNAHVNQIKYNRRKNATSQNEGRFVYAQRRLPINGQEYPFIGSAHWYFNPAVWRMSFIRPRWKGFYHNVHHALNSPTGLLPRGVRPKPEWYADELGVLTWGGVKEPAFFEHLGVGDESIHKKQGRV